MSEGPINEDLELLDSIDDKSKDDPKSKSPPKATEKDILENAVESTSKTDAKDSVLCSIARNRPVRSSSIKSQKCISDYFGKK